MLFLIWLSCLTVLYIYIYLFEIISVRVLGTHKAYANGNRALKQKQIPGMIYTIVAAVSRPVIFT